MKEKQVCGHCHERIDKDNERVCCVLCGREMCQDCISLLPSVGYVCGLCYDRQTTKEED